MALLAMSPPDGVELAGRHLQELAPVSIPFRVSQLSAVPPLKSMAPPQDGIVCVLVPTETEVSIGIAFDQADDVIRQALLHAYGHLLLGHVRPGDAYGHWDTTESLGATRPHRRWDREVQGTFCGLVPGHSRAPGRIAGRLHATGKGPARPVAHDRRDDRREPAPAHPGRALPEGGLPAPGRPAHGGHDRGLWRGDALRRCRA